MEILQLFRELNKWLSQYSKAYILYRTQTKQENVKSKKTFALDQMREALSMIEGIIDKIDFYFEDSIGDFVTGLTENELDEINDEYVELLTRLDNIEISYSLPTIRENTEVSEMHERLINRFTVMESNISYYNSHNLGFKVISPEEAHKYYDSMRKRVRENRVYLR